MVGSAPREQVLLSALLARSMLSPPLRMHSLLQVKGLYAGPIRRWWLVLRSTLGLGDWIERAIKVWVCAHRSARVSRLACSQKNVLLQGVNTPKREKSTVKEEKKK